MDSDRLNSLNPVISSVYELRKMLIEDVLWLKQQTILLEGKLLEQRQEIARLADSMERIERRLKTG